MSALKYTAEEAQFIIEMACLGQPLVITDLVMAGTSGPVSLAGLVGLVKLETIQIFLQCRHVSYYIKTW